MIQKFNGHVPQIDDSCYIAPGSAVIGDVKLGKNVSVWHNAVLRGDVAAITVGDNTNIQDLCIVHCAAGVDVKIGSNVTIGHGAILHSCQIDDESLIGMGAIILDGAKIGKNCLIAAGAVVTPNSVIPEGYLAVGSPATLKRKLTDAEISNIIHNAKEYAIYAKEYKENS